MFVSVWRKWAEDAHEESSEDERLPADEDDQKHLTTRWTNQSTLHSESQYLSQKAQTVEDMNVVGIGVTELTVDVGLCPVM